MTKKWTKGKPARFDDLTKPLVKAIRFAYTLKRKNRDKDIPYSGYDRPSILHTCLDIKTQLTAEQMLYDEEAQGRDAIEVLVALAIQLGYEQGLRKAEEKQMEEERIQKLFDSCKKGDYGSGIGDSYID